MNNFENNDFILNDQIMIPGSNRLISRNSALGNILESHSRIQNLRERHLDEQKETDLKNFLSMYEKYKEDSDTDEEEEGFSPEFYNGSDTLPYKGLFENLDQNLISNDKIFEDDDEGFSNEEMNNDELEPGNNEMYNDEESSDESESSSDEDLQLFSMRAKEIGDLNLKPMAKFVRMPKTLKQNLDLQNLSMEVEELSNQKHEFRKILKEFALKNETFQEKIQSKTQHLEENVHEFMDKFRKESQDLKNLRAELASRLSKIDDQIQHYVGYESNLVQRIQAEASESSKRNIELSKHAHLESLASSTKSIEDHSLSLKNQNEEKMMAHMNLQLKDFSERLNILILQKEEELSKQVKKLENALVSFEENVKEKTGELVIHATETLSKNIDHKENESRKVANDIIQMTNRELEKFIEAQKSIEQKITHLVDQESSKVEHLTTKLDSAHQNTEIIIQNLMKTEQQAKLEAQELLNKTIELTKEIESRIEKFKTTASEIVHDYESTIESVAHQGEASIHAAENVAIEEIREANKNQIDLSISQIKISEENAKKDLISFKTTLQKKLLRQEEIDEEGEDNSVNEEHNTRSNMKHFDTLYNNQNEENEEVLQIEENNEKEVGQKSLQIIQTLETQLREVEQSIEENADGLKETESRAKREYTNLVHVDQKRQKTEAELRDLQNAEAIIDSKIEKSPESKVDQLESTKNQIDIREGLTSQRLDQITSQEDIIKNNYEETINLLKEKQTEYDKAKVTREVLTEQLKEAKADLRILSPENFNEQLKKSKADSANRNTYAGRFHGGEAISVSEYLNGGYMKEDKIDYLFRNHSDVLQDSQKAGIEAVASKTLKNLGIFPGTEEYKSLLEKVRTNLKNNKIVRFTKENLNLI